LRQVDGGAASYTYGGEGERVRKDTASGSTEYVYFGGNVIAERSKIALNTSMFSQSGLSNYVASAIADGSTACCGWHTDSAVAGAWLQIDLGARAMRRR